jgi:hypothetical protein
MACELQKSLDVSPKPPSTVQKIIAKNCDEVVHSDLQANPTKVNVLEA